MRFSPSPASTLSTQPDSDPTELRALSYFQHRAISELGGVSPELWLNFILPVSHHDKAIKHAIVALVLLHEDYASSQHAFPAGSHDTLLHYGKAVNELLQLEVSTSPDAAGIALVSCVLFYSLEVLRGHYQSALTHVQSGKKILEEEKRTTDQANKAIPRRLLEDIFQRMDTQVIMIGDKAKMPLPIPVRPAKPAVPPIFKSVQDAFLLLEILHHQILHFFSHAAQFLSDMKSRMEAFAMLAPELSEFEKLFLQWQKAFGLFVTQHGSKGTEAAILLLNILSTSLLTIFPAEHGRHATEPEFDRFTEEFDRMVDWSDAYVRLTSNLATTRSPDQLRPDLDAQVEPDGDSTSADGLRGPQAASSKPRMLAPRPIGIVTPSFSMSTGIIPSLFLCGVRCRDPQIRRKALHLLQTCNRREGLWDSNHAARIVEVVIRIEEEKTLDDLRESGKECTITHASQIPEAHRVVVMGVEFGVERSAQVTYQVNEACPVEGRVGRKLVKEEVSW